MGSPRFSHNRAISMGSSTAATSFILPPHCGQVSTSISKVRRSSWAHKRRRGRGPYQIDNPYVDSTNNSLTTVVERFKGEALAGHVTLMKGERSPLAELSSNLL